MKARFGVLHYDDDLMVIEDLQAGYRESLDDQTRRLLNPSLITNDAAAVVNHIVLHHHLGKRRLFYVDTEGDIDELEVKDGKFHRFGVFRMRSLEEVIAEVKG